MSHRHAGVLILIKRRLDAEDDLAAQRLVARGGLGGLILGSEAQRVLAHSKIPVLVIP